MPDCHPPFQSLLYQTHHPLKRHFRSMVSLGIQISLSSLSTLHAGIFAGGRGGVVAYAVYMLIVLPIQDLTSPWGVILLFFTANNSRGAGVQVV
jgi:hypothetical protein